MDHYDLVVIGSGPSGRRAAIQAAKLGKSVLVIEGQRRVGGVSVHTGTIPSKTLRETALNLSGWRERGFYGQSYRAKKGICSDDLGLRLTKTLAYEVDVLEHQFLRNGVETVEGRARLDGPGRVIVTAPGGSEQSVGYAKLVIAVGTVPHRPGSIPFDHVAVLDSDEMIDLPRLPRSIAVVGAGVIGIEYATILSALDVSVTIVEARDAVLDFIDREIIDDFVHQLRNRGVVFRLGSEVAAIERQDGGKVCTRLKDGRQVVTEMLLYCAGRIGAAEGLGLETCGIRVDERGRIAVDPASFQTSAPDIYATGDIIGFPSLASTAMEQGRIAACHAFDVEAPPAPRFFPYGIYAVPEISTVGMSEEEVRAKAIPYECGIARMRETSRGHIMGLESGLLKMIFSTRTRKLLGVHIIGEGATELIHIGQAVLNLKGGIDYFIDNTFNYPTLAEAYKIAALDAWNRMAR